ncbi:MAG: hypothetical protein H0V09_04795 [Gemmatimonadetes bacterium]|nr:hypothetical protein [Gemmatimonadota bacterium]
MLLSGCGGSSPVLLAPDGRGDAFQIFLEGTPATLGVAGSPRPVTFAVRVEPLPGRSESPVARSVSFEVVRGGARVLAARAETDAHGVAAVEVLHAGRPDSSRIRARVEDDPGAALDARLLSRALVHLEADSGTVVAIPAASAGVLLRVPTGQAWDLVPHVPSARRGHLEYAWYRSPSMRVTEDDPAAPPPALQPSRAPAPLSSAWFGNALAAWPAPDWSSAAMRDFPRVGLAPSRRIGAAGATRDPAADDLPSAQDVFNCRLSVHARAPLARVGQSIALYVHAEEPPDPARVGEVAEIFDGHVAPLLTALFGDPTDLDRNGRVLAVLSDAMEGGVYCGAVHGAGREVMYGSWSPQRPPSADLRILAHEFQHVINASQHYRRGSPATSDEPWLNEGLSMVAEWKAGYPSSTLSRSFSFLGRVNQGIPLLGEQAALPFSGGWFLFALYLGDRFGDGVYRELGRSGLTGRANVERVTGMPLRALVRDWFVALARSDVPAAPGEGSAWSYRSIQLAGEEERARVCDCLPAPRLPGIAWEAIPASGNLNLLRTLAVQDADFFRFTPGESPGVLYFHAGGDPDVELFAIRRR